MDAQRVERNCGPRGCAARIIEGMRDQRDENDEPDERDEQDGRREQLQGVQHDPDDLEGAATEVVVLPLTAQPAPWRSRAVALRTAIPQLARHPVVVAATAAAATVAVRVAVDVARQAVLGSGPARPVTLEVSGSILHRVEVNRTVHVVQDVVHHHVVHHVPAGTLWRPELPPR